MTDQVNMYLRETLQMYTHREYSYQEIRPRFRCKDGFCVSIQASAGHYCDPRLDGHVHYTTVELGYPTEAVPELLEYAEDSDNPTETVYGWVPVDVVNQVIEQHGGPLDETYSWLDEEKTDG